jgi:hypothetical protein
MLIFYDAVMDDDGSASFTFENDTEFFDFGRKRTRIGSCLTLSSIHENDDANQIRYSSTMSRWVVRIL